MLKQINICDCMKFCKPKEITIHRLVITIETEKGEILQFLRRRKHEL